MICILFIYIYSSLVEMIKFDHTLLSPNIFTFEIPYVFSNVFPTIPLLHSHCMEENLRQQKQWKNWRTVYNCFFAFFSGLSPCIFRNGRRKKLYGLLEWLRGAALASERAFGRIICRFKDGDPGSARWRICQGLIVALIGTIENCRLIDWLMAWQRED